VPVQIIVLSRQRPGSVGDIEHLFPDSLWCIGANEAEAYAVPQSRKLIHPADVVGIGKLKQWVLDNTQGTIFLVDDDIAKVWCMVGRAGHEVSGAENIRQIIENAAEIAEAIGAPVFGFDQAWDVRKFHPMEPFLMTGWVSTALGFIGREIAYDETLLSQADIDFCLRCLLKKRLIFVDQRFSFVCKRFNNRGGSAGIRSMAKYREQIDKVCRRWGQWIWFRQTKGTYRLGIRVSRRQPLDLDL
jgi:hypothetical protein